MEKSNVYMRQEITMLSRVLELFGFIEAGTCEKENRNKYVKFPVSKFHSEELV